MALEGRAMQADVCAFLKALSSASPRGGGEKQAAAQGHLQGCEHPGGNNGIEDAGRGAIYVHIRWELGR